MTYTNNILHFSTGYNIILPENLAKVPAGTHQTNLLYFSYSTGKLTPVEFLKGPKGGWYLLFFKTKQHVNTYQLEFYEDGTSRVNTANGSLFISTSIDKVLPKLQSHCKENVDKFTRYLTNWQSKLDALSTVADDFPEYFL